MQGEEGFLLADDGTRLFFRRWEAEGAEAVCLLAHGLGEHSGRYEGLAHRLTERRFSLWALDHRGHGRSQGLRGDCRSLEQLVEDFHRLVERARQEEPRLPRIMVGHSLGGLIALAYAVRHPEAIRALAVSSPALRLAEAPPKAKVLLAHGMARWLPTTPIPNGVAPSLLSHDPQVAAAYESDPLVHRLITARCAVALDRAMKSSLDLAEKLSIPCLILQAGADRICAPEAAAEFAGRAAGLVTFRRYEGLYHELFNELDRDRVIEDLVRWLEEVVRG